MANNEYQPQNIVIEPVEMPRMIIGKKANDVDPLKSKITFLINNSNSDLQLLEQLNDLVICHGDIVCQIIFKVLADFQFDLKEALIQWENVYQHNLELNNKIEHPVALITSICDYFSHQKLIGNPLQLTTIEHFESLVNHSTFDRLTGLPNRNCFNDTLAHALALTKREGSELSLTFLDIDDFKDVNDTYGHQVGDQVLSRLGKLFTESIRQSDIAFRYGGEEFVILMPNTDSQSALKLSDRIRRNVMSTLQMQNGIKLNLTISGGIAVYPLHAANADELIKYADNALYQAKGSGKNTITLFKNESRHCPRIPLSQKVSIKELNFDTNANVEGWCKNISLGGILFNSTKKYVIGDHVQLCLELHSGQSLLLFGTIIRVEHTNHYLFTTAISFSFGKIEKIAKKEIGRLIFKNNGCNHFV